MTAKAGSDWKSRLADYESVLSSIESSDPASVNIPDNKLLDYISDVNSNCQLEGLKICEAVFKISKNHQYANIARTLLTKNFASRPQNGNKATDLIKICFTEAHDQTKEVLLEEIHSKNQKVVSAVLSIFSYFASQLSMQEREEIITAVTPLSEHRVQTIRKEANELINTLKTTPENEPEIEQPRQTQQIPKAQPVLQEAPAHQESPKLQTKNPSEITTQKSPEIRKSKKKVLNGACYSLWTQWATQEIQANLDNHKWQEVTAGIDGLRKLFDQDTSYSNVAAFGLLTVFISRTFTPRVMNQLTQNILFYMKFDPSSITEDTLNAGIKFFIDKISDKRMENDLFELGDIISSHISVPTFFQSLYPSLSVKNPSLITRTVAYCTHSIRTYQANTRLDATEVSSQIHPLLSNADPNVRKAANECVAALASVFGEQVLDEFKTIKKVQMDEIKKIMKNSPISQEIELPYANQVVEKKIAQPIRQPSPHVEHVSSTRAPTPPVQKQTQEEPVLKMPKKEISRASSSRTLRPKKALKPDIIDDTERPAFQVKEETKDVIPKSLLQSLKTAVDTSSLTDVINQINDILSTRSAKTIYSDVEQCITSLAPVLSEDNVNLLYAATQLMMSIINLIKSEIEKAPVPILASLLNTLNYNNKKLKKAANQMLLSLYRNDKRFMKEIFVCGFGDLTPEGKNAALGLILSLSLPFDPASFVQIVANLITDQENLENSEAFINLFLENGGKELLKQRAKQMITSKKTLIMRAIHEDSNSIFVDESAPTTRRAKPVDNVAVTIAFNNHNFTTIENQISIQWRSIFNLRLKHTTRDTFKVDASAVLAQAAKDSSSVLRFTDLLLLWCAINYKLDALDFLRSFLDYCVKAHRSFDELSICICIPLILELEPELLTVLQKLAKPDLFITCMQTVCESSSNESHLINIFSFIQSLELSNESSEFFIDRGQIILKETTNQELIDTINRMTVGDLITCEMSPELSEKMEGSFLNVYEWIYKLSSSDTVICIQTLKEIIKQLEVDASVFNSHLEPLILVLIAKIHVFFCTEPPPVRLYKYICFCVITLLEKTDLAKVISYSSVNQIVVEIITRLCNGFGNDQNVSASLNVVLSQLIKDCSQHTFKSLLNASAHVIDQKYPEIWVKLAIKCFHACVNDMFTNYSKDQSEFEDDIIAGIVECENVIKAHGIEQFKRSSLGLALLNYIREFVRTVVDQYPEILQRPDVTKLLGTKIYVLSI